MRYSLLTSAALYIHGRVSMLLEYRMKRVYIEGVRGGAAEKMASISRPRGLFGGRAVFYGCARAFPRQQNGSTRNYFAVDII